MMVYTGKKWEISPTDFMSGDIITVIEADNDNNIWIGTYTDGIYILNQ
jgi:ligand-binding sensor domain-containing protein